MKTRIVNWFLSVGAEVTEGPLVHNPDGHAFRVEHIGLDLLHDETGGTLQVDTSATASGWPLPGHGGDGMPEYLGYDEEDLPDWLTPFADALRAAVQGADPGELERLRAQVAAVRALADELDEHGSTWDSIEVAVAGRIREALDAGAED